MTALEVSGLTCRRGGRPVFDDLSFSSATGALLALTGRNGSGKTTLLRALALMIPATVGTIRWQGSDVTEDRETWRRQIAWLGHLDGLKGDLTIRENLVIACHLRETGIDHIDAALTAFDLAPLAHRPVRTLSAGQRRRAALARMAASAAPVWLLDEPLNALDAPSQAALLAALGRHLAGGGLAIAATHAPIDVPGARTLDLSVFAGTAPFRGAQDLERHGVPRSQP